MLALIDRIKALLRRPKSVVSKEKAPAAEREPEQPPVATPQGQRAPSVKGQKRIIRKRVQKTGKRKRSRRS
jgi:hypothetical protein